MIRTVDQGHIGVLTLLDLSAAFDTVDHSSLTDVLTRRFGIHDGALGSIQNYLSGRPPPEVNLVI